PAGVIGQVLRVPMKEGQAFTAECFATGTSGLKLAGTLRPGMRAVSVPLSDSGGIENLLYPGCIVDVLASLQVKEDGPMGDQTVGLTLLPGVNVLAVGDQTVTSTSNPEEGRGIAPRSPRSTVTLLVDAKQAEMIYLARQRGNVSIALRNPSEQPAGPTEGT